MDIELIKFGAQFGSGFLLAIIVLLWKREDDKRHDAYLETTSESLLEVLKQNTTAINGLSETVRALTVNLTRIEDRMRELERIIPKRAARD